MLSIEYQITGTSTSTPGPLSVVASEAMSVWSIWEVSSVAPAAKLPVGTNIKIGSASWRSQHAHTYKMHMRKANKSGWSQKFRAHYVHTLSLANPLPKFLDQRLGIVFFI